MGGTALAHGDDIEDDRIDAPAVAVAERADAVRRQVRLRDDAGADGVVDIVVEVGDAVRHGDDLALERGRRAAALVVQDAVAHLEGQVEPLPAVFQKAHHAQALHVVLKAARHELREHVLAAVAKGRVPEVVPERDGLRQILVERSAREIVRAICATSSVCVRRVA